MNNDFSIIGVMALASLAPFLIACGTCYIKFSIVFVMVRNAIGLQQIPSNLTLNSIAFILSVFVMLPFAREGYDAYQKQSIDTSTASGIESSLETAFGSYKDYLVKYTDKDLAAYFEKAQRSRDEREDEIKSEEKTEPSLFSLLPAYALTEIADAFKIGFYIYLPFVVIDLLVSGILLTLGMMMMSPVTISIPIKLLLFVCMDGWSLLSKGLIEQYLHLS